MRRLFLHGVPTDSAYWSRTVALLDGENQCPDLVGDWRDAVPGSWDTVVGVDYGGLRAAQIAREGRAGRLVLMSTAWGAGWLPSILVSYPPFDGPFYRWSRGERFLRAGDPSGALARRYAPADPDLMIVAARSLWPVVARRVAPLSVPSLCLWGAQDRFFPPALGRRLARQLGGAFQLVPGAHTLAWTAPEAVAAAIVGFEAAS